MTTQAAQNPKMETTEMFRQATDTFKSAMQAGLRFQQDAFKAMTEAFGNRETFEDACHRIETVATDSIGAIRKNAEQTQRFFDEGCKNGMTVMQKSFETGNGHGDKDVIAHSREVWQSACDAMKANLDAATRASSQAIENWASFFGKTMTINERKAGK